MILGVWDEHDSGAAIIDKGKILSAANEERFTKRKLEINFPYNSINYCLKSQNLKPRDIQDVAYSTSDFSLTLTRLFPQIKNDYYYVRRKMKKAGFHDINRRTLNLTGRIRSNKVLKSISDTMIKKELKKIGFNNFNLHLVDHHDAHAASAYFTSGMNKALSITMDGLGDGLSSTISICDKGNIEKIQETRTKDSLGLFYQEITSLLGMRILEDEGKVMCLADYSNLSFEKNRTSDKNKGRKIGKRKKEQKAKSKKNPMLNLFEFKNDQIRARISLNRRYRILEKLLSKNKRKDFCKMAQNTLEHYSLLMFENAVESTGIRKICLSGGIFSNIKNNMNLVNNLEQNHNLKDWFIFPHMGDGGLAVGAALYIDNRLNDSKPHKIDSLSLGPGYSKQEILKTLNNHKHKFRLRSQKDISGYAAEEISRSNIIYWFQGNAEYGPRALGNRSILTLPGEKEMRDKLNRLIKRRDWFQPFCPAMLESEARNLLEPYKRSDPFMTMGYPIKDSKISELDAARSIDGSCRPQIINQSNINKSNKSNKDFHTLLKKVKRHTGTAAILNTSFNIHGDPLVTSPEDALKTLLITKQGKLIIGDFVVEIK